VGDSKNGRRAKGKRRKVVGTRINRTDKESTSEPGAKDRVKNILTIGQVYRRQITGQDGKRIWTRKKKGKQRRGYKNERQLCASRGEKSGRGKGYLDPGTEEQYTGVPWQWKEKVRPGKKFNIVYGSI